MKFQNFFATEKPIIGMVHLRPLPGSPRFDGNIKEIYAQAEWEATILADVITSYSIHYTKLYD